MSARIRIAILCLVVATCSTRHRIAHADDAGAVADAPPLTTLGSAALPPVATVPDPIEHPVEAWSDAKLAAKTSWPLAVFVVLLMLTKALAYGSASLQGAPVIGAAAKWLALDKHAMWVSGAGAVAAAGYNALVSGGTLVAGLVAAAVAFAGLVHPTTQKPAA